MRIVWNSFHGRYSDSPRALYERLDGRADVEHVWLAHRDFVDGFPADVETVDIDGPAARPVLESADLVVASSHTELEWEKPEGATYLQTWHGTPLKRVHRDVLWAPDGVLDRLDRDVAMWDLLLSPNPTATERLRHAFRWTGPVLESGYPRNDVLAADRQAPVRAQVRAELGVTDDQTLVLYAPTWRDRLGYGSAEHWPSPLDPDLFHRLGPDYVLVVRAHHLISGRLDVDARPWVRDASFYPDIAPLYAAADAMVTDYSSAMFDFAVTGRPLLFLVPDYEEYRDSGRGFYADPTDELPGPLLRDGTALVAALADLPAVSASYAGRYAAFRERYTTLADGHASERVLTALGLSPGSPGDGEVLGPDHP